MFEFIFNAVFVMVKVFKIETDESNIIKTDKNVIKFNWTNQINMGKVFKWFMFWEHIINTKWQLQNEQLKYNENSKVTRCKHETIPETKESEKIQNAWSLKEVDKVNLIICYETH